MSESTTPAEPTQPALAAPADPATPDTGDAAKLAAEVEKWKALARKHEDRAKENSEKAKGFDDLKRSSMSEQEKAVEEARNAARAEAQREAAPRLVSAEFRAQAAGRFTAEQVAELIEDLDMAKYLTESGEVDSERVARKVAALAPQAPAEPAFPDLGQGVRHGADMALNGDPLLDSLKNKLGIR